jgi:hypothetical protein
LHNPWGLQVGCFLTNSHFCHGLICTMPDDNPSERMWYLRSSPAWERFRCLRPFNGQASQSWQARFSPFLRVAAYLWYGHLRARRRAEVPRDRKRAGYGSQAPALRLRNIMSSEIILTISELVRQWQISESIGN